MSESLVAFGMNMSFAIRYLLILIHAEYLTKLIQNFPKSYTEAEDAKFNISKELRRCRIPFTVCFLASIFALLRNTITHAVHRKFFVTIKFPFDTSNDFAYYGLVLWLMSVVTLGAFLIRVTENILTGMTVLLVIEFQRLSDGIMNLRQQIEKLSQASSASTSQNIINIRKKREITRKVHEIIQRHVELLDTRDGLENIFAPAFLITLVFGVLGITSGEFQILIAKDIIQKVGVTFISLAQVLTTSVQCYYGQKLKDASKEIADAIYDSKWEEIDDPMVRRDIIMVLMRSQNSKTLTCWKFAENSIELFSTVSIFKV